MRRGGGHIHVHAHAIIHVHTCRLEQSLKVKFDIPEAELKCEREVNRVSIHVV